MKPSDFRVLVREEVRKVSRIENADIFFKGKEGDL